MGSFVNSMTVVVVRRSISDWGRQYRFDRGYSTIVNENFRWLFESLTTSRSLSSLVCWMVQDYRHHWERWFRHRYRQWLDCHRLGYSAVVQSKSRMTKQISSGNWLWCTVKRLDNIRLSLGEFFREVWHEYAIASHRRCVARANCTLVNDVKLREYRRSDFLHHHSSMHRASSKHRKYHGSDRVPDPPFVCNHPNHRGFDRSFHACCHCSTVTLSMIVSWQCSSDHASISESDPVWHADFSVRWYSHECSQDFDQAYLSLWQDWTGQA